MGGGRRQLQIQMTMAKFDRRVATAAAVVAMIWKQLQNLQSNRDGGGAGTKASS